MSEPETYLTEAVLTIQHEVQQALDYIETVAVQEPSELGAASSLLTIENLRVRIPLVFRTEQQTRPIAKQPATATTGVRLSAEELARFKDQLRTRTGLLLGVQEGQLGTYAKISVKSPASLVQTAPAEEEGASQTASAMIGEIEITLTRVPRDLDQAPSQAGTPVPDVLGKTLDGAERLLQSQGWRFQPHAAAVEESAAAPESYQGRVVNQDPAPGVLADKATTVVGMRLALSTLPVTEIDGIGKERGSRLASAGITNVGQLSLASAGQVASILSSGEPVAQAFIDMASFMSRLTTAGLKDEVVELLVKGAELHSMEELAGADPVRLHAKCVDALEKKAVQVPREFSFTAEDVWDWVQAAQSYLKDSGLKA